MDYIFKNGKPAGHGVKGAKFAICEGDNVISFTYEDKTTAKKISFSKYSIGKQERLIKAVLKELSDITAEDKQTFLSILERISDVRKASLCRREVRERLCIK